MNTYKVNDHPYSLDENDRACCEFPAMAHAPGLPEFAIGDVVKFTTSESQLNGQVGRVALLGDDFDGAQSCYVNLFSGVQLNTNARALAHVCAYSTTHAVDGIPAVTVIDCGPVGKVRACQWCADFYNRNRSN